MEMKLDEIPHHLYPPTRMGHYDRMVGVYYDRYIVYQLDSTDDIIKLEGDRIFSGKDDYGNFLWRVFDGYLNQYVSTGYISWEYSHSMRDTYSHDCMDSSIIATSLVEYSHAADVKLIESIWIDDESGKSLLTDSQIYEWRAKFTDEEREMARHPNRGHRWLPQRLRIEINSWVRKRLTCEKCGIHNFHSFRETDLHEKTCMVDSPRLILLKKRLGIS